MPRQIITTDDAPRSPLYSQGVTAGSQVYVSGTPGIDPATGTFAGDTIQDQTRQALTNCEAILRAGGASLDDVLEVGHPAGPSRGLRGPQRGVRAVVLHRTPDAVRREARGRRTGTAGLDPHDRVPRLSPAPGSALAAAAPGP